MYEQQGLLGKLFDLHGKTAFVTGAARGMGAQISLGLAACGADVALAGKAGHPLPASPLPWMDPSPVPPPPPRHPTCCRHRQRGRPHRRGPPHRGHGGRGRGRHRAAAGAGAQVRCARPPRGGARDAAGGRRAGRPGHPHRQCRSVCAARLAARQGQKVCALPTCGALPLTHPPTHPSVHARTPTCRYSWQAAAGAQSVSQRVARGVWRQRGGGVPLLSRRLPAFPEKRGAAAARGPGAQRWQDCHHQVGGGPQRLASCLHPPPHDTGCHFPLCSPSPHLTTIAVTACLADACSSIAAQRGFGAQVAYCASKGALLPLSKSLAVAWGPDNVQVGGELAGGWNSVEACSVIAAATSGAAGQLPACRHLHCCR